MQKCVHQARPRSPRFRDVLLGQARALSLGAEKEIIEVFDHFLRQRHVERAADNWFQLNYFLNKLLACYGLILLILIQNFTVQRIVYLYLNCKLIHCFAKQFKLLLLDLGFGKLCFFIGCNMRRISKEIIVGRPNLAADNLRLQIILNLVCQSAPYLLDISFLLGVALGEDGDQCVDHARNVRGAYLLQALNLLPHANTSIIRNLSLRNRNNESHSLHPLENALNNKHVDEFNQDAVRV